MYIVGQHKDSGRYELVIQNKYGEISTSGWIDVLSKPEIIGLKDQTSLPSSTIAFDAIVLANPKPKVTWTRGNENLCNNENCEVIADPDDDKYRLVFQCVKPGEDGLYTLTAVNDQGTTTASFRLNVKGEHFEIVIKQDKKKLISCAIVIDLPETRCMIKFRAKLTEIDPKYLI